MASRIENGARQILLEDGPAVGRLSELVALVRPPADAPTEEIDLRLRNLAETISQSEQCRGAFRRIVEEALGGTRLVHCLAESGILRDIGFLREFSNRVVRRVLPERTRPDDVRPFIRRIFTRDDDWRWIEGASTQAWAALFGLLVDEKSPQGHGDGDVAAALQGLAQRIGALGIDEELNAKLHEVEDYHSPFLDLTVQTHAFLEDHRDNQGHVESYLALEEKLRECRDIIVYLRKNKQLYGTSLRLTAVSRRLLQQLDRLELLIHLVRPQTRDDYIEASVKLFQALVKAEQTANSVVRLVKESADLLAFQIAEQSARKGQKYITDSRRGYWAFLRAAIRGGALVAVFAITKIFLEAFSLSLAGEALVYSINYSICFVLIYLTGSILATKQPAVLASAIARAVDESATEHGALEGVADVIILAWRSQFVSFVGNLICALPLAWLLSLALSEWLGHPVADPQKAAALAGSVHPLKSAALYYAAIAGLFLFASGVIAGAVANHLVYADIEKRLAEHPGLAFLGQRREHLASFVAEKVGMLSGNVALGFFLGCAGTLGVIIGIPFDIRHVAFSSAHVGIALFISPELFTPVALIVVLLGVVGIGFVNFLMSFALTLVTGLQSRRVSFGQSRQLLGILMHRLIRHPLEWIWPPSSREYALPRGMVEEEAS